MQIRGTVDAIRKDFNSGRYSVTISVTEGDISEVDAIRGQDLSIELKKYRNPRSHSANALLWHCIGEIAQALGGDKWDIYLNALRKYGKYTLVSVRKDAVDAFRETWRECEEIGRQKTGGEEWVHLLCYFGSSTYDSKEFSVLLDGIIDDMKQAGIPTPTSEEMRRTIEALERSEKRMEANECDGNT